MYAIILESAVYLILIHVPSIKHAFSSLSLKKTISF